jgi:hypothetical protein
VETGRNDNLEGKNDNLDLKVVMPLTCTYDNYDNYDNLIWVKFLFLRKKLWERKIVSGHAIMHGCGQIIAR